MKNPVTSLHQLHPRGYIAVSTKRNLSGSKLMKGGVADYVEEWMALDLKFLLTREKMESPRSRGIDERKYGFRIARTKK